MTELLYRSDAYLQEVEARVTAHTSEGGLVVDRSVFYASAGGQPGDQGLIVYEAREIAISNTIYDEAKNVVLAVNAGQALPVVGSKLLMRLDWPLRYRNMRVHTMMHLLCAAVPFPVTGGAISADGGRIDFDIPDGRIPDKTVLTDDMNKLIADDHPVSEKWVSDEEMAANMHLVRTMSVKPPMGTGRVRLVMIGAAGCIDLQPCGGTHVRSTGEIGPVSVAKIENKGKINRRIRISFV